MSKFRIAKQFDFCYGHRVWSQTLNKEYSLDNRCVCRHLHGHQGKIILTLEGRRLQDGMITDFKHLNWFKKFLDDTLDHKFIVDTHDPLFDKIVPPPSACVFTKCPDLEDKEIWQLDWHAEGYATISEDLLRILVATNRDLLEGFVIVKFVPTSENLSRWLLGIAKLKMEQIDVQVTRLQFFETPKSQSLYIDTEIPLEVEKKEKI